MQAPPQPSAHRSWIRVTKAMSLVVITNTSGIRKFQVVDYGQARGERNESKLIIFTPRRFQPQTLTITTVYIKIPSCTLHTKCNHSQKPNATRSRSRASEDGHGAP